MLRQMQMVVIVGLFLITPLYSQAAPKPAKSATQKTPGSAHTPQDKLKADVNAFVTTLNNKDALPFLITKYVWGARIGFYGASEWHRWFRREHIADDFSVADVKIHKITASEAEASISYRTWPTEPQKNAGPFTLKFDHSPTDIQKKEPKVWQFVPRAPLIHESLAAQPLLWAVWMLSQSPETLPAFRTQLALVNLTRLVEGARKFQQDFDTYAFSSEFQEEALQAYLKHDTIWLVPGTNEKFLFNNRLSGKTFEQIAEPARTILFYEGKDEKPNFRNDGKTFVCLADGRVELADAERFKSFAWE